jgi:hypothetical protein
LFHLQATAESKFLCYIRTFHFHGCKLFYGWWPSKFIYSRNKPVHINTSIQLDGLHTLEIAITKMSQKMKCEHIL